ncbi:unnamed protein product [Callosobruchus maculatus]|uniref:Peptidase S1 domain-containing protein n=1 Tax=Callosobruchus maculatus TaxID=64391 RepID=A0A653BIA6_CALMS|nr:unnamed protein product [Callosobruchus maculatus]
MDLFYKVLVVVLLVIESAENRHLEKRKLRGKVLGLPRIIGGHEAVPHAYPYQAGIVIRGDAFCGGSLISRNFVLTAAHCVDGLHNKDLNLILGAHRIFENESTQVRRQADWIVVHENYNRHSYENDIALIKLSVPVELNDVIKTIPLPESEGGVDIYSEQDVISTGWGLTRDVPQPSINDICPVLQVITLQIISYSSCKAAFKKDEEHDGLVYVTSKNMCTSGIGIKGTCDGDSGGPLQFNGTQIGIVSIGTDTCESGAPSIFTRVDKFLDWIQRNSDISQKS